MGRKFQENFDPDELAQCLTRKRLSPYLEEAREEWRTAFGLYERNLLWSARLWIVMHLFEVTLRNRVDQTLSGCFGRDWLMPERELLRPREVEKVWEARETLERYKGKATRDGIIAELNFGFWVFLFSRKYDDRERAFWRKALYRLFPGQSRRNVHDTLEEIRKLRNRVAHHERIHQPERAREMLFDMLNRLSPEMGDWATGIEMHLEPMT